MAKKTATKKKAAPKKTTALSTEQQQKAVWAGHSGLQTLNEQQLKNQALVSKCAQIFNVPPNGVDILGGKPYVNKTGLTFKLEQYFGKTSKTRKGQGRVKGIRIEFIEYAKTIKDIAIAKAIIEFDDDTFVEGIGEASPANVNARMEKVAKSLNMLAETRATNRAIAKVVIPRLWQEVMDAFINNAELKNDAELRGKMEGAITVSAEEMDGDGLKPDQRAKGATPEAELRNIIIESVNKAQSKEMLEKIKAGVETSARLSDQSKKMLIGMIDGKISQL